MLSASVVPHHHHDGGFCIETTGHTGDEDSHGSGSHGYCVAESEYTDRIERDDKGDCSSAACGHEGHAHLFAAVYLYTYTFPDDTAIETDYGEYIVHYHSLDARTGGGLRAPPSILC